MLAYEAELELLDKRGEIARFKKRQRVKLLQDYVIAFQDYAWGQGKVLGDYHCSPGQVVDRWREGERSTVLISLRETKQSGDVEEFYIERTIRRGFNHRDEWWQIEMQHQTRWLRFSLIFPKGRARRRVALVERQRSQTNSLDPRHLVDLPNGRQVFTWEIAQPRRFETYTFTWTW